MSESDIWLTIGLLTVATILTRSSFFFLGHAVKLPPKVQHALRYAPAAALAAIVAPDLVLANNTLQLTWANPKLMAGLGAALFFLTTRHLLGTIVAGMGLYTLLRIIL
ncbi:MULTISPECIES: AzlD domain-containing protein [Oxalobacteraceae]|jgi:branched-subunit amino acid transport protein|uniref:AzlD domain-containing protein n=1 Tax=Oxalobacteraceae TaxID=75682 RepID=UPI0010A3CA97|nr:MULTISPECIES: AzlD domain-containing protein [Oxalobacteraceae]HJV82095.1 AzlD domain-containing protein [Noviherbaspirillum sp.]